MKLVAANHFFNTKRLGITVPKDDAQFRHENHVHKGLRFCIGGDTKYTDLSPEQKQNVGALLAAKAVVLDDDENKNKGVIEKIDREAAEEFKAHKAALKPQKSLAEVIAETVATAVTAALAAAKGPAKAAGA